MGNATPMGSEFCLAILGSSVVAACLAPDFVVDPPNSATGSAAGAAGVVVAGAAGLGLESSRSGAAGKSLLVAESAGAPNAATTGTNSPGGGGKSSNAGGTTGSTSAAAGAAARAGAAAASGSGQAGLSVQANRAQGGSSGIVGEAGGTGSSGGHGDASGTAAAGPTGVAGANSFGGDTHPSCKSLTTRCQGESCCTTIAVPGGDFAMGRTDNGSDRCPTGASCAADEQPEHSASIAPYFLDKYEVTVGRFRQFVSAYTSAPPQGTTGSNPHVTASSWNSSWTTSLPASQSALTAMLGCDPSATWSKDPGTREALPINCVDWYLAYAFCAWDNGRLPTEAEWEFAAAGGADNSLYPWGSAAPDATRALYYRGDVTGPVAVGSAPAGAGKWHHLDLSGSMWEWSFDGYSAAWYADSAAGGSNPANRSITTVRAARGGSWADGVGYLRSVARYPSASPTQRVSNFGIRCARDVP